jgi:hypothetical protein
MNRLSLGNNWLKLETSGGLLTILEESKEYTSNKYRNQRKITTLVGTNRRLVTDEVVEFEK